MDAPLTTWKAIFRRWPAELARRGVVVTLQGEQIPFAGFLTCEGFVLLARTTPDAIGARTVVLPYENVAAVKLVEVAKPKMFALFGFEGELPKS